MRTGAAILTATTIVLVWPFVVARAAEPPQPDLCKTTSVMTLTGKIRSLQSMREEPQAEIQTFFVLDLAAPLCGTRSVTASTIGRIACGVNDTVEMTGEYSPPERMFNTARLRGRQITKCLKQ